MTTERLTSAMLQGVDRSSVRDAISNASAKTGVDFSYLFNQAKSESGLNPNAHAVTSTASGLFQFIDQTWLGVVKQHGAKHGMGWAADAIQRGSNGRYYVSDPSMRQAVFNLRNQAEPAALMAAESAGANAQTLSTALGRDANSTDLYFAHFLGPAGATKFLKANAANPDATAASIFPREASVNRGIFYNKSGQARSLGEVYALMSRKINGTSGTDQSGSPVQMASRAGELSATPPGAGSASTNSVLQALAATDTSNALPATDPTTTDMLALMGRNGQAQILKPSPQFARLAYMLLGNDINDPTVTNG